MKLCMYACMYVTMQHKDKDGRPQSLAFLLPTTPGKRGGGGGGVKVNPVLKIIKTLQDLTVKNTIMKPALPNSYSH